MHCFSAQGSQTGMLCFGLPNMHYFSATCMLCFFFTRYAVALVQQACYALVYQTCEVLVRRTAKYGLLSKSSLVIVPL